MDSSVHLRCLWLSIPPVPAAKAGGLSPLLAMPTAPLSPPPPDLLAAALGCFTQHGLPTTSTHQLAQAAGLSHGSLYRLIGSKDQLLEDVYTYDIDRLLAPLAAGGGAARPGRPCTRSWPAGGSC